MATTLEVVRNGLDNTPTVSKTEHFEKLRLFVPAVGRSLSASEDEMEFREECKGLGFSYFVRARTINKFKYHAGVGEELWLRSFAYNTGITYSGDLPDFALDNAIKIRESYIGCLTTIHSMQPLPVERVDLRPIDPVLIQWPRRITLDWRGHISKEDRDVLGCVVAMWDMDKEIEL